MNKAVIHFDGGCKGNPGAKYGSYAILFDDCFLLKVEREQFGHGTNNEAEFNALIASLRLLNRSCTQAGVPKIRLEVEIHTDSRIVWNWLRQYRGFTPKANTDERRMAMYRLAGQAVELLQGFTFEISWTPREKMVELFGH